MNRHSPSWPGYWTRTGRYRCIWPAMHGSPIEQEEWINQDGQVEWRVNEDSEDEPENDERNSPDAA